MNERTESHGMFLGAIALALFGIFAPYKWHDMPSRITNSALVLALFLALWAVGIWLPSPAKGVKKSMAALLIAAGACALITGVVLFLDSSAPVDDAYLFYWVEITNPNDLRALLPVHITSRSPGTFEKVDPWWAPWGSEKSASPLDTTTPYWSIGKEMKVFFSFVRAGALYGRAIRAGDYLIQYDATLKDVNYHFDEHLNIEAHDGSLVQKIDVWRMVVPGGQQSLVYSADSSKSPIQ